MSGSRTRARLPRQRQRQPQGPGPPQGAPTTAIADGSGGAVGGSFITDAQYKQRAARTRNRDASGPASNGDINSTGKRSSGPGGGRRSGQRQRRLQRWDSDWVGLTGSNPNGVDLNTGLEEDKANVQSGAWDQFEANSRLRGGVGLGFQGDDDALMAMYTTRLPDRGSAAYRKREAEADRIAQEIMTEASTNIHVREERGQIEPSEDVDEETRYGAVVRPPSGSSLSKQRRAADCSAGQTSIQPPNSTATATTGTTPQQQSAQWDAFTEDTDNTAQESLFEWQTDTECVAVPCFLHTCPSTHTLCFSLSCFSHSPQHWLGHRSRYNTCRRRGSS